MKRWLAGVVALAVLALAVVGCGDAPSVASIYVVPSAPSEVLAGEAYLDHPFPSDFRLVDGKVSYAGFYNPRKVLLVAEYASEGDGLIEGFSPAAAGYVRFEGALDAATLPATPVASLASDASVQLIDVDPNSPEFGQRKLIQTSFRAAGGHYVLPNTLRWMPVPGYPLRSATRYALITTDALRSSEGGAVTASTDLQRVLGVTLARDAAATTLANSIAPDVDVIEQLGVQRSSITQLAVFTTSAPTQELAVFADHLRAAVPAPNFAPRKPWKTITHADSVEYFNDYGPSPNYQRGALPFTVLGDGGELNWENGEPAVVDEFDLRFSLTVPSRPACAMPAKGYPVVLYAHGTGGHYRSYYDSGIARNLAQRCIASMGVDQIFHGTRPGASGDAQSTNILFFNFQNIHAARANARQSALDEVQRARLFTESHAVIPALVSHTGEAIRFDPSKVLFFGHSQGGLNGPLYLAVDDSARGGVLSASGGVFSITLLEKTAPAPSVADLVRTIFLALTPDEYEELDIYHPVVSLAQSLVDVIDPIHYARHIVREPRPGYAPKSILLTEGIAPDGTGDHLTPPHGIEAQAVALGLPLQAPAQRLYRQLDYGAAGPIEVPAAGLSGNLADGLASGVLAQWPPPPNGEGHFVVFDVPAARAQAVEFLVRLAADPVGNVPPPFSP